MSVDRKVFQKSYQSVISESVANELKIRTRQQIGNCPAIACTRDRFGATPKHRPKPA